MNQQPDIHQKILEGARVAVAEAIETHRRLGQSIVVMRDGKITWLAPEEIPPLQAEEKRSGGETES